MESEIFGGEREKARDLHVCSCVNDEQPERTAAG
jgi:hypothetical protein